MVDELDFGTEVICSNLANFYPPVGDPVFNEVTCQFREVGHIGIISSVFPNRDAVWITHREFNGEEEVEFITAYRVSEIEKFNSLFIIEESELVKAINKMNLIQITAEVES